MGRLTPTISIVQGITNSINAKQPINIELGGKGKEGLIFLGQNPSLKSNLITTISKIVNGGEFKRLSFRYSQLLKQYVIALS